MAQTRQVELWRILMMLLALGALVVLTAPVFGYATRKALGR